MDAGTLIPVLVLHEPDLPVFEVPLSNPQA